MSSYCSSKYAVAGPAKCVVGEVGAAGVRAGYIYSGPVDADMMRRIEHDAFGDTMTHEGAEKVFPATAPDKRYCQPEEVTYATRTPHAL